MLRSTTVFRLSGSLPRRVGLVLFNTTAANKAAVGLVSESQVGTSKPRRNGEDKLNRFRSNTHRKSSLYSRTPYNRKLADISHQIDISVSEANPKDLTEAIDIFEEGVSYLREIQHAENIDEERIYRLFQRSASNLLESAIKHGDETVIDRVLDIYVANRVAHMYHFLLCQQYLLKQGSSRFADALSLWIKFLEYSKSMPEPIDMLTRRAFGFHLDSVFKTYDMASVTYFVYVMQCIEAGIEFNLQDTAKILQLNEISQLPTEGKIRAVLSKLGLNDVLSEEINNFGDFSKSTIVNTLDPNSESVIYKINGIVKSGNALRLKQFYDQMITASIDKNIPLTEDTLVKVMSAFIELQRFSEVFEVFQTMVNSFKPSATAWAMAIKAMGHPKYVETLSQEEKDQLLKTVESTLSSMEATGVSVNAKVLAVVVGAMANLNRPDRVGYFLNQNKNVPVVHLAKNNILIGLTLNRRIDQAERLMKEYFCEDSKYIPLISVLNSFLSHYVAEGNDKAVDDMLKYMSEKKIVASLGTITIVVNHYFKTCKKNGKVPDARAVLSEIGHSNIKWDDNIASTLLSGLTQDGTNLEAARGVFDYFTEKGRRYKFSKGLYTPMIKAELEFGDLDRAERLFAWYNENLGQDTRMWNMMILSFMKNNEAKALNIYKEMKGVTKPNHFTFYFLLSHFLRKKDCEKIQWLLKEMAASDLTYFGLILPDMIQRLKHRYEVDQRLLSR